MWHIHQLEEFTLIQIFPFGLVYISLLQSSASTCFNVFKYVSRQ